MKDKKVTTEGAASENLDCVKQVAETATIKLPVNATGKERDSKDEKAQADAMMQIILAPVCELEAHPLVKDFYPIDPEMLASMTGLMKECGYDPRFPIQVCIKDGKCFVWDGITRLKAATDAEIKNVPVIVSEFATDDDLMEAVVEVQLRRRNSTARVIIASVERLIDIASRKAKENQGRRTDLLGTSGPIEPEVESGGANEYIARMIGRSATTVKHIREVIENPMLKQKVMDGEISPNKAYEMLHPRKPSPEEISLFLGQNGKLSDGDEQDGYESPAGKSGEKEPSATLKTKVGSTDEVTPVIPSKTANKPKVESKTQDIPVPQNILALLVHHFPKEHIAELAELLSSCDPELAKLITSIISGSEAA